MGGCGWFWVVLVGFGWFWVVLASFGWFWLFFVGFGWFWLVACFITKARAVYVICSRLTIKIPGDVALVPLLLTLNRFHTLV